MTPFDSPFAENYLVDILNSIGENQYPDAVAYIVHMTLENLDDLTCTDELAEKHCFEIWTAGCLMDAVLNHTDYSNDCRYYLDDYIKVVKNIEEAFQKTKRKFFRKKLLYNQSVILYHLAVGLLEILTPDIDSPASDLPRDEEGDPLSALGAKMQMQEKFGEWEFAVMDLHFRLFEHINLKENFNRDYNQKGVIS